MSVGSASRRLLCPLACVSLLLVGCPAREEAGKGGDVLTTLRVLVHEGGPRFTALQPELLSVALLSTDGPVLTGAGDRELSPGASGRAVGA
jgi:hypothetical protein